MIHCNNTTDNRLHSTQPLTTSIDPNPNPNPDTSTSADQNTKDTPKMASDEDYAAFLEKANADPNEGVAKTKDKKAEGSAKLKAVDSGAKVPKGLKEAVKDQVFVSDSDEPFEPVSLKLEGDELPDESMFVIFLIHSSLPTPYLFLTSFLSRTYEDHKLKPFSTQ